MFEALDSSSRWFLYNIILLAACLRRWYAGDSKGRGNLLLVTTSNVILGLQHDTLQYFPYKIQSFVNILSIPLLFTSCKSQNGQRPAQLERQSPVALNVPAITQNRGRMRSLFMGSRTTHTRFFPEKHSFSYSYLLVGIPIHERCLRSNLLSADTISKSSAHGWFHVDAANHLERASSETGLSGKLREYLRSQHVQDNQWETAYLVTAPAFMGYAFNPVSFWYIYSPSRELRYMILEVNNTFDERRMYLLPRDSTTQSDNLPAERTQQPSRFKQSWAKDFHVSPFNSRKGSYSLTAHDPFSTTSDLTFTNIDNTITLRSSKSHAKLVARISSVGSAQDPTQISSLQFARFIFSWFWVGFATNPRIVFEAGRLYFKRGLHVWFRPEVAASSIGRQASATERTVEHAFSSYLTSLVYQCPEPVCVKYTPADIGPTRIISSAAADTADVVKVTSIELRVLTPAFYSRLPHYASLASALQGETLDRNLNPLNRTLLIDDPNHILRTHILPPDSPTNPNMEPTPNFRWRLMRSLRTDPPAQSYPNAAPTNHTPVSVSSKVSDKATEGRRGRRRSTSSGFSDLDIHVLASNPSPGSSSAYRRAVTVLLLSQRLTGGFEPLLSLLDVAFRFGMLYAGLRLLMGSLERPIDVLGGGVGAGGTGVWEDMAKEGLGIVLAFGVETWEWVKG